MLTTSKQLPSNGAKLKSNNSLCARISLIYASNYYVANANRTIITMAMIETRSGLDNLDEILSVEGLDAIYVGPADLALALGCEPQLDPTEENVLKAIEYIVARARKKKIVAGIHTASTANA